MRHYPVFLDLRQRSVIVTGGGFLAEQKAARLLAAGANVRRVDKLVDFTSDVDLCDVALVVAASRDIVFDRVVADAARARNIPVNVADTPGLGNVILPAVVDRDPVTIAISTDGTAPVLARRLREKIEALLEPTLGVLARFAQQHRARVQARVAASRRRRFWEALFDGEIAALLRQSRTAAAERAFSRDLDAAATERHTPRGHVSLVGAGSGDADLVTLRALRALQDADVIFHDALVDASVLALARVEAERVDVGKRHGALGTTQARIHELLLAAAREGKRVVRLKCGDPLTFARGGEELEFLRAHDIAYDVVPGITAAQTCAAYAGVPLTHRDHAQSVRYLTAHCAGAFAREDDRELFRSSETLVVYMGVALLPSLVERLIAQRAPRATPVAIIENGGRASQRVVLGNLDSIAALAEAERVIAPSLLVVGEVAALAESLHWYGAAPITIAPPVTAPSSVHDAERPTSVPIVARAEPSTAREPIPATARDDLEVSPAGVFAY
jgi:uroporphyrin-III C-methyltransferase/precorrin-2 dehydrogenase/sirohydrochlorin ferrochelatase